MIDLKSRLLLDDQINTSCFESWMGPAFNRRPDGIHLNSNGHDIMEDCISQAIDGI